MRPLYRFILSFLILLLIGGMIQPIHAQAVKVNYTEIQKWEEIKDLAQRHRKPVFVDFYADWCPPCKAFNENVLGDREVAAFLNRHYISIKLDAEAFPGSRMADELGIKAYPTIFLIDRNGVVREIIEGLPEYDEFFTMIRKVRRANRHY